MRISVIGSGAWGTALSISLIKNGHDVTLHTVYGNWSDTMRKTRENPFLKGVLLPKAMHFQDGIAGVCEAEVVILVTLSFAVRENAHAIKEQLAKDAVVISASKGIESGSLYTLSQVICDEIGQEHVIVAISGPSHAEEVSRGIPTGCVAASRDLNAAKQVQDLFMSQDFRFYTSDDIQGVELCGALKNIIALCAGVCEGVGFGDNTIAMLLTRGLNELSRLGVELGGRPETFMGLAGLGDLVVTCTSKHSRNRRAGVYIGEGLSVQEAMQKVGAVVEGYHVSLAAKQLVDRCGVEAPIIQEAYRVMYEGRSPKEAVVSLMTRGKKREF